MLVEFRVTNFRSIKEEQVFSMVASKDRSLREHNVYETGLTAAPGIIRSAGIFGANASGKSNLIRALAFMRAVVLYSEIKKPEGAKVNLKPFLLDKATAEAPSSFEVTFLIDKVRYQYGFSLDAERITSEYLFVYKKFKPQQWFSRFFDPIQEKDIYEFKTGLSGPKHLWQEATRPDSLFVSIATQLNSKDIKPIYDWFSEKLKIFDSQHHLSPDFTANLIANNKKEQPIMNLLKSADIGIEGIDVKKEKFEGKRITFHILEGEAEESSNEMEVPIISFYHRGEEESVRFKFDEESDGTQVLFALAGPTLDILEKGRILIVDELDSSLHPLLLRDYIKLFHDSDSNTGNAQLIFSTHDVSLLDTTGLLRRDQVYFTEKGSNQATKLLSLADFSPRASEDIERRYLSGRYGGVPFIDGQMRFTP